MTTIGIPPLSKFSQLKLLLVCALWAFGLIQIIFPTEPISYVLAGLLVCFALISLPNAAWNAQLLCTLLAIATIALGYKYDSWQAIFQGLSRASIFPAFLSTIVLLRAAADQRPEIQMARHLFSSLDKSRRDSGLVVGGFLLGSVLQVGVFAIMAPILGRSAPSEERLDVFVAAMRGMALVPFWSPFVVGMAVASQYLPSVPLWQIISLGLGMSAICILLSIFCFDRAGGLITLWRSLMTLAPIAPPIAIAALLVVGTTLGTGYSTLQALVLAMPLPCLIAVSVAPGGSILKAFKSTGQRLTRIGSETAILTFATILGMVFESSLPATGLLKVITSLNLTPTVIIFFLIMAMNILGLLGVHSIVSGTILLVLFTGIPTGLSNLVLMQALLVGWGLCTATSIGSLSIVTGATMFELPVMKLITWKNIVYIFVGGTICAIILAIINPFLLS